MLGLGKAREVRAFVTASSPRSQDGDLYRRYAAALYRQALLTRDDPPLTDARYRLTESVLRRCHQLVVGLAWQVRQPGHLSQTREKEKGK
jgi:hypothetical protein